MARQGSLDANRHRRLRQAGGRHRGERAGRPAQGAAVAPRAVRRDHDGKVLELCARPQPDAYDMPTVRKIVRDAARNNYRFSSLVMGIAQSAPFQMERVPEAAPSQVQVAVSERTVREFVEGDRMFITKKHLERRTFLRGMGAAMALPLLDAMIPARTALAATAATPTPHMGFIYFPHGAIMEHWTPADGRHHLRSPHHSQAAGAFPEAAYRGQRPGEQARHQPGGARHHARNMAELRTSARQPGSFLRADYRSDCRGAHRPGHAAAIDRNSDRRPRRRRFLRSRLRLQLLGHHFVPHSHHAASHGD